MSCCQAVLLWQSWWINWSNRKEAINNFPCESSYKQVNWNCCKSNHNDLIGNRKSYVTTTRVDYLDIFITEEILISCGLIQAYQQKISKKCCGVCRAERRNPSSARLFSATAILKSKHTIRFSSRQLTSIFTYLVSFLLELVLQITSRQCISVS